MSDPFHVYVLPSSVIGLFLLSGQHLAFLNGFLFMFFAGLARTFSKAEEPKLDEMYLYF
jgi:hypothetical protein